MLCCYFGDVLGENKNYFGAIPLGVKPVNYLFLIVKKFCLKDCLVF